eukprot:comp14847_c0_seq2/m.11348 comp14847_c0_seq2/g.11348  ORF comp14847_c0_seq2/g.11348 comp14847_c0_seq2/m.11348 type:complete len:253 (-) comp14847_c0_seq2:561-1319(-)
MMGGALAHNDCRIGLIIGRGTNMCYLEETKNITKQALETKTGQMVVNCEWGDFDPTGQTIPHTPYDDMVDARTANRGRHRFEKMISGQYLGELTRVVLYELAREGMLFKGHISHALATPWALDVSVMSVIESDTTANLYKIKKLMEYEMGLLGFCSFSDRLLIRKVCELVSSRAAMLAGCGVAAVAEKMGVAGRCVVAVNGSVFRAYPLFPQHVAATLDIVLTRGHDIHLYQDEDLGAKGAATIAAMAVNDH